MLWEWLTDFNKLQKWNKSIVEEELISSGEVGIGFVTKVLIKEGKKNIWYENEILKYEPNKALSIALKGGSLGKSPMIVDYMIKENNGLSELSYSCTWKPVGFLLWLLHPIIKKMANKNVDDVLIELKKQIENQKVPPFKNKIIA